MTTLLGTRLAAARHRWPCATPARTAQRPARLLRLHRLHRARRDGDCRRRLGRRSLRRRSGARGPHVARRRRCFSLIQREAKPEESAFLRARGRFRSRPLRASWPRRRRQAGAGRAQGGGRQLPDARGGDARAQNADGGSVGRARYGAFGAAVDPILLARLDLKLGDRISIGNATFQIRSVVAAEPDKLAGNVGLGPRVLVSEPSLRATGLLQPGSLVRWIYRVKLPIMRPTIAPRPN